jgi:hypothetical protein
MILFIFLIFVETYCTDFSINSGELWANAFLKREYLFFVDL